MQELWIKINKYNFYEVSNMGNVRSINKFVNGGNGIKLKRGKKLKLFVRNGYYSVGLSDNNKVSFHSVHRLVAKHFIDNSQEKPTVNHIDGNKLNNVFTNLEWATQSEQIIHAIKHKLYTPPIPYLGKIGSLHNRSKSVSKMDANGHLLNTYGSASEAGRKTGLTQTGISKAARGELKTCGNYKWIFNS